MWFVTYFPLSLGRTDWASRMYSKFVITSSLLSQYAGTFCSDSLSQWMWEKTAKTGDPRARESGFSVLLTSWLDADCVKSAVGQSKACSYRTKILFVSCFIPALYQNFRVSRNSNLLAAPNFSKQNNPGIDNATTYWLSVFWIVYQYTLYTVHCVGTKFLAFRFRRPLLFFD